MGPLRLLFVVETSGDQKSDVLYLNHFIQRFYLYQNSVYDQVSHDMIYMDGKHNYNAERLIDRIENERKMFRSLGGDAICIYVVDTDSEGDAFEKGSYFDNLRSFCEKRGYELAWMCRNIEEVFLGKEVHSKKTATAKAYVKRNEPIDIALFHAAIKKRGNSNLATILDLYLKRK